VRCWGANHFGQLGDGTTNDRAAPAGGDVLAGAKAIAVGDLHTCAVTGAGGVRCWGHNLEGEAGDGSYDAHLVPPAADALAGAQAVAAGFNFTCALTTAGGVRCWGYNSNGQIGDDTEINVDRLRPADTDVLGGVAAIAVGTGHTCALTASAGVRCWGANAAGQLGNARGRQDVLYPPKVDIASLAGTCP